MYPTFLADFVSVFAELKTLSLKDWTTLLPILIGFCAFLWRKMLSSLLHKVGLFFRAPSMIEALSDKLDNLSSNTPSDYHDTLARIENHLAMNEARNKMLMSNLNVPMWEANANGQWTWCNDELLSLLGVDIHNMLQDRWLNSVQVDELDRVMRGWYDSIEKDRPVHQIFNFVHKDGDLIRVKATSQLVKDIDGETVGILGSLLPII